MKTIARILVVAVAALAGLTASAQGIPVYDNASLLQAIQQAAAQAKDYAVQIKALETQVKSMESATQSLGTSLNIDPTAGIQKSLEAVKQGAAMSGGASQALKNLQTGYSTDATIGKTLATTRDTIAGAVTNAAQQQDSLAPEAQRIKDLAAQSQAATGLLEVQQAGNQINVELVQQVQKSRAQQLAQDQATSAALLQQQRAKEAEAELSRRFIGGADIKSLNSSEIEKLRAKF